MLNQTHARLTDAGRNLAITKVVFRRFDTEAKTSVEIYVNWQDTFAFLRAHPAVEVAGVICAATPGIVSFAKWVRNERTRMYRIEVGCFSHTAHIVEVEGPSCPCAYFTPRPQDCALHPMTAEARSAVVAA